MGIVRTKAVVSGIVEPNSNFGQVSCLLFHILFFEKNIMYFSSPRHGLYSIIYWNI